MKILLIFLSLIFASMIIFPILDFLSIGITLMDIFPYQTRGTEWYKLTNEELFERFITDLIFLIIGSLFFIGCYFFMKFTYKENFNTGKNEIYYSKCPKCKKVFNYKELANGKCKNCKEVDTVDLDEYFEKYPNELKEKTKNVK